MRRRRGRLRYLSPAVKWAQYKKIIIQPVTFWGKDGAAFAATIHTVDREYIE